MPSPGIRMTIAALALSAISATVQPSGPGRVTFIALALLFLFLVAVLPELPGVEDDQQSS